MAALQFIVFGVVLTGLLGLLASWVDRKVTARLQYRVGPPLAQPLWDLAKLMGKETLVPAGAARTTFLAAPVVGLAATAVLATLLWVNNLWPASGFLGDYIVVLYLLTVPSTSLIIGAFASGNPLASYGGAREMKLVMAYELPFLLAVLVPVILAGYELSLGGLIEAQATGGAHALHLSGLLALLVALLCMQAKLTLVPFDIPEAETEIASGVLIEYSGPTLAFVKLMRAMLLFTLPFFLIILFMGGLRLEGWSILWGVLKVVGLVALVVVLRNTNPRLRIDQGLRLFWGPVTILAVVAVVLAIAGW